MVGAVNSGQSGSSLVTGSYAEKKIGVQESRSRVLQIGWTWCSLSCWAAAGLGKWPIWRPKKKGEILFA